MGEERAFADGAIGVERSSVPHLPFRERYGCNRFGEGEGLHWSLLRATNSLLARLQVGSFFEIKGQKPAFGFVNPSSPLYLPLLGSLAVLGAPAAAFLCYRAVKAANEEFERQDRMDGEL